MLTPQEIEQHRYDAFLSASSDDREWAVSWLLPRLRAAGLRICTEDDFAVGLARLLNVERSIGACRHTLVVLTPAWLQSEWNDFEALLSQTGDPSGRRLRRTIPLLLRPCELPLRLALLSQADFTRTERWDVEIERVIAAIRAGVAETKPSSGAELGLAALPLDAIPNVAPLPPGSRMPLGRNPLFVGREDDLKALAATLKGGATAAIGQIAAATGLGGIGKTQLACEFVHRYGQFFSGGVFWLSFADPAAVPAEVAACGAALGLPGLDALALDAQVACVRQEWQSAILRLLVFDNCEDEALLEQWRPTSGGCRVLLTSRRPRWHPALGVNELALGVLPRSESVALLEKFLGPSSVAEDKGQRTTDNGQLHGVLDAIAAELGDLPLALHLAGSFLAAYRHARFGTPQGYLTQLRAVAPLAHASLQGEGEVVSPTGHALHVGKTFTLSYERLEQADATDALAIGLLARAGWFAPGEPIERELVIETLALGEDDAAALRAERALGRLVSLGLLEEAAGGAVRLHRLLAAYARGVVQDDAAQGAVEQAMLETARRLNKAGIPAPLLTLQPHLRSITDTAKVRLDERAASLCNELGYYFQLVGDYAGARPYFEQALAIRRAVLGERHPDTARSLNNLGALLDSMGDLATARPYYEQALAIYRAVLGERHPDTATSLNNLGYLLQAMGNLNEARPYFEQALAICRAVLGEQHPDTATSLNNLGALLKDLDDLAAARPYYEQALAIRRAVLGEQHPNTVRSLNNLGALLLAMGDLAAARPCYEQALAINKTVLGEQHPDTALSLNNLGALLYAQGDLAGARPYFEQALAIQERALGSKYPDTATSLRWLGTIASQEGDLAAARAHLRRALAIFTARLGAAHPRTQQCRRQLDALGASPSEER